MTSPGTYSAGTAYLDVIPSFDGVQKAIAKEVRQMEKALGSEAGDEFGKAFEEKANKAVDKALGTSKDKAAKAGKDAGQQYGGGFEQSFRTAMQRAQKEIGSINVDAKLNGSQMRAEAKSLQIMLNGLKDAKIDVDFDAGQAFAEAARLLAVVEKLKKTDVDIGVKTSLGRAESELRAFMAKIQKDAGVVITPEIRDKGEAGRFAREVRTRIEAALKNFPDVEFDADLTPAQEKMERLRQELVALGDKKIGIDIDGRDAIAEMERIRMEVASLATDKTVEIEVQTDAAGAAAELLAVRELAKLVSGTKVEVKVDVDERGVRASLARLRSEVTATGNSGQEGANAFRAFNGVILAATTLLPAAIPLVGALGGALALLGPLAVAGAAGLTVTVMAFSGISDAVKAMGKVEDNRVKDAQANAKKMQTASTAVADAQRSLQRAEESSSRAGIAAQQAVTDAREDAARAAERAARDVSDARENEARVAEDTARSIADALENQRDAEEALGEAQERVIDAQLALTRAREEAQEQQEDATLALRDSRLDAEKAEIDLLKAEKKLREILAAGQGALSDNDWAIKLRSAQYDVNKYALAIDTANERTGDLTKETEEFARTGVEGSQRVIDARRGVADAEDGVRDAQERVEDAVASVARAQADASRAQAEASRAVIDAVQAQERTRIDGQRAVADAEASARQQQIDGAASVADAQRNLTEAQQRYSDALFETGTLGSESMQALDKAMGALGPAGQRFATFIFGIKDQMRELRDLAQAGVLPGVEDAISNILTNNGPGLKQFISDMAFVIGDLFRKTGELFTSPQWQGIFDVWGETAPIFMQQLGDVGLAALTFFGELFRGLAPYAVIFGDKLVELAENSAAWMAVFVDSQTFRDIMDWLFTNGPIVWDTLVDIGRAIGNILVALGPFGSLILQLLDSVAEFIADMDTDTLGVILIAILGFVASFQVAMGLVSTSLLLLDAAIAPVAGMILVIGAVVTGLVILYTTSETFRDIVNGVFDAVGTVISWWWENIVFPIFNAVGDLWNLLIDGIVWAWENLLRPAWDAISQAATWLYENVLQPVFTLIGEGWSNMITGMKWFWDNVLNPLFNIIAEIAKWLLIILTVVVFGPILVGWELLMMSLKMLWDTVGKPLFDAIAWVATWLWENVLSPVWDKMKVGWEAVMTALELAYENIVKPMFERFAAGVAVLQDAFGKGVDAIGAAWDLIKEKTRGPINWVIDTVLNNGLLKAFNTIIETLNLPGDWKVDPLALVGAPSSPSGPTQSGRGGRQVALAAGGGVPGWSPNDRADNIPAMLTAGEHVQPVKRVKQYGMDLFEAFRSGIIDPRAARSLLPGRQAYAEGGPVYQQLFSAVKKRFPRARLNSGLRSSSDLHGQGLAVDLGEQGFSGGRGRPYLADMNRDLYDRAGKFIHELIYTGAGDDRPDLKAGRPLNYGAATNAGHVHHVHLGVRDIMGFLRAYGAGDGGGVLGAAGNLLGGVWDSVAGVFGSLKDSLTAPLQGLSAQFGESTLGKLAGGVAKDLPGKMWEKIKGSVSDAWNGMTSNVSAGFNWAVDKITGGSVQDKVRSAATQRGWGEGAQWDALGWIIDHESDWNPNAQNPTSTAYGLFQFLNSTWAGTGVSKTSDVTQQAIAGMNYIANRYKDPVGAKRFWEANGWYSEGGPVAPGANSKPEAPTLYDSGGWLQPGLTTVLNATNKPEPVLTGAAWDELISSSSADYDGDRRGIRDLHIHEVQTDMSEAIDTVNHWVKVYERGGRYAGAGTGND